MKTTLLFALGLCLWACGGLIDAQPGTGSSDAGPGSNTVLGPDSGVPDAGVALQCYPPGTELQAIAATGFFEAADAPAPLRSLSPGARMTTLGLADGGDACPVDGRLDLRFADTTGWMDAADLFIGPCTTGSAFAPEIEAVITSYWGPYADAALSVSKCESGYLGTTAMNGQYLGLFQMGTTERATYGDSICAEGQSQAAAYYFEMTGANWGPWTCKPQPDGGY